MNKIKRRQFLISSLSGLLWTSLPKISFATSNPDVVVIGAGSAGLSATAELMDLGYKIICDILDKWFISMSFDNI